MGEIFSFKGKVETVYNSNLQWKKINVSSYEEFEGSHLPKSIAGKKFIKPIYYGDIYGENLPLIEGLVVKFNCVLNIAKNGKQYLHCINWSYERPDNLKSIKSFLMATLGKNHLLSSSKIDTSIAKYGEEVLDIFKKGNTNALFPIFCPKGAKPEAVEKMEKAIDCIRDNYDNNEFVAKMAELGVSPLITNKIMDNLHIYSVEELKKNPYTCMSVSGISFKRCDQIAIALNVALDSPQRIVACTQATMQAILTRRSSLYCELEAVKEETLKQLNNSSITRNMWTRAIADNLKEKEPLFYIGKDSTSNKQTIMLTKDANNEIVATRKIHSLQVDKTSAFDVGVVKKLATNFNVSEAKQRGFMLTDEQIDAIARSLSNKVSIITGGPGTGKTTITQMIIQIWKVLSKEPVTCLAPTGKAATRMKEQTGINATTIHRAVRIIPDIEEQNLEKLKKGLIIIDESSMIDQETLTKMICCVPNGSSVIFLGDIDQLPSVGKGDVLHQLIKSSVIPTSRLTATKRQAEGSPIIENAQKINSGDYHLTYDNESFSFINACDGDTKLLTDLYLKKVAEYGIDQVAVLCPLRKQTKAMHRMVSDNLNVILRDVLNPKTEDTKSIEVKQGDGKLEFREGDRIMSWKNVEEVANGDIGVIKSISENEFHEWQTEILWEGGHKTTYNTSDMENLSLAYSMSIHKSQGSQYRCVIMPIMSEHNTCNILSRNLIYTGVTRAKQECIILGDIPALKKGIEKVNTNIRSSYLSERLRLITASK